MASNYSVKDIAKCWSILTEVLSYGHTVPFVYMGLGVQQKFFLTEGMGGWGYCDHSCAEYLLDDIQFALFDQKLSRIELHLSGHAHGPICDIWKFTFAKDGLVEAYNYYNDD